MTPSTKEEFIERIQVHARKLRNHQPPEILKSDKPVKIRLPKVPNFDIHEIL